MTTLEPQQDRDLIAALRSVNPVTSDEIDAFRRRLDSSAAIERIIGRNRRNVGSGRRRLIAIVTAMFALAAFPLLIAPAFGIGSGVFSFFDSPPAEQPLKTIVYALAEDAPPGMDPGLRAQEARVVTTMRLNGVDRTLWVAPTEAGGLCYGFVGEGGGCDALGTVPLSVSWGRASDQQSVAHVHGFVRLRYAERLEIRFRDGDVVRPLLIKVTEPINVAFFTYDVPESKQSREQTVSAVAALADDGQIVTEQAAPLAGIAQPTRLADALVDQRRRELAVTTDAGEATLWTAPTRYGGRCVWLEVAGERHFVSPCKPAGYGFDRFGIQPIASRDVALLAGTLGSEFDSLSLEFADGERASLRPNSDGFVLYAIPPPHAQVGHEPRVIVGRGANGSEITRLPLGRPGSCYALIPTSVASGPADCPSTRIPDK